MNQIVTVYVKNYFIFYSSSNSFLPKVNFYFAKISVFVTD